MNNHKKDLHEMQYKNIHPTKAQSSEFEKHPEAEHQIGSGTTMIQRGAPC